MKKSKKEIKKVWLVAINLVGIHGPIRCYRKDEWGVVLWDRGGNWNVSVKSLGIRVSESCSYFSSTSFADALLFAKGARALARRIKETL